MEATRGPLCILAGAGTGKTTTITRRIAWQVASGAFPPEQIVAVTFTDKAAGELRARLRALGTDGVRASTFHSADDGARSKSDPLAKCPNGIEDRAGRARERPAVQHNGIDHRTPAADEPRPVRFPLDGATEARTVDAEHMETHYR